MSSRLADKSSVDATVMNSSSSTGSTAPNALVNVAETTRSGNSQITSSTYSRYYTQADSDVQAYIKSKVELFAKYSKDKE